MTAGVLQLKVTLNRIKGSEFRGENEAGEALLLAGTPEIGPADHGVRPMQALLMSLAGCSSMDVLMILQKGRHQVHEMQVEVEAERADAIPAVFERIHLHFKVAGDFPLQKLERAARLSMEKYCSVSMMLKGSVAISHSVEKLSS